MNPRTREIAAQAKQCALDAMIKIADKEQALMVYSESYDTKFAELIVKETMQVVANNLPQNTYLDVANAVIEHFGVEP